MGETYKQNNIRVYSIPKLSERGLARLGWTLSPVARAPAEGACLEGITLIGMVRQGPHTTNMELLEERNDR